MKFLKKIFGKGEKPQMNGIGEIDHCPYCKEKLEKIPTRKSKCPHCKEYIYSRTRPSDRKKILIREDQIKELENEWSKYYDEKEKSELYEQEDFKKARDDLTKQFGKEPSINDVKWRVYNERTLILASNRQWGLYRNNKLDMAKLLQKENRHKQAIDTFFEICYLDLNGCRNMPQGLSQKDLKELKISDFDPKTAFLAPGIISMLKDSIEASSMKKTNLKKQFIDISNKTKPIKDMPVSADTAWKTLEKEL